jgi:hypothetical protein
MRAVPTGLAHHMLLSPGIAMPGFHMPPLRGSACRDRKFLLHIFIFVMHAALKGRPSTFLPAQLLPAQAH